MDEDVEVIEEASTDDGTTVIVNEAPDDEPATDVDVTIIESPTTEGIPVDVAMDIGSRLARLEDAILALGTATVDIAAKTDALADVTEGISGELGTLEAEIEATATAEIEQEQEMEEVVADDPPITKKRNFHRTWFGQ